MTDVLVVAELLDGQSRKTTLSAIAFARRAHDVAGGDFDILVIGVGAAEATKDLALFGARAVLYAEDAHQYVAERYAATVAGLTEDGAYGIVVATASSFGKDLLPRVAAKLGAGVAPDISDLRSDDGELVYTRAMYAGNVLAEMSIRTKVHVVSVRQTEFEPAEPSGGSTPTRSVEIVEDPVAQRIEAIGLESQKSDRPDLTDADIVVAGGRGLKSAENFHNVLEPLADALGAAVGASRAACDAGYVSADLQIGQTGKVVAPKLYIAVGISGAIQHLAGMKGSRVIVAINKDREAPIAQVADYFLVADLFDAVPKLTAAVRPQS